MRTDPNCPAPGPTVGRVDNDQDLQERVLADHLAYLRGLLLPLLAERAGLESRLDHVKQMGRDIERRAFGVLLTLGKTEKEAREEIASWQHTRESR